MKEKYEVVTLEEMKNALARGWRFVCVVDEFAFFARKEYVQ